MSHTDTETATFAGGCFWCTEAVFKELKGVVSTTVGYAGGHVENPSYEEVCTGTTGHAECVQVEYDPDYVSFEDLLEIFFHTHDPTTEDRQGPDVGSQYRSVAFYHNQGQKERIEEHIKELESSGEFDDPIVTEVVPLEEFYVAEEKHQDYFEKHPNRPYCAINIKPKIEKVNEKYRDKVKH